MFRYYDFFAGAGLAGLGLGPAWRCVYAIDNDPKKVAAYTANFGADHLVCADVHDIDATRLPDADMAWASFPCQDLSVAGQMAGLSGQRSGAYWGFWKAMRALKSAHRCPTLIVLENVTGMLRGPAFLAVCESLVRLGLKVGAVVMDAANFVPQSRPRVFIVAAAPARFDHLAGTTPDPRWTTPSLVRAAEQLPARCARSWIWWRIPAAPARRSTIHDAFDNGAQWWPEPRTRAFLKLMPPHHRRKLDHAACDQSASIAVAYKRTRQGRQCAEVRVDGVAGCLRAPRGGSSRQILARVEGARIEARLLSAREAARLMGVPDSYVLPERYNDAYHAMGDGVVVPVVGWLSRHLLEPICALSGSFV